MQENNGLRELCIKQGHVPAKCRLPGMIIAILASKGKDPCVGCNFDRDECGGRDYQHQERFYEQFPENEGGN